MANGRNENKYEESHKNSVSMLLGDNNNEKSDNGMGSKNSYNRTR